MKLIEQVEEILKENKKPMHVNDIATVLVGKYPYIQVPLDKLPSKIASMLSANIKTYKIKSIFSKPKNKQGRPKKGMYRVKHTRVKAVIVTPTVPELTTGYIGKAGEHAVLSELLYYGYNASIMTVDDGIDIVASKNEKYFHIQVKTSNANKNTGKFGFTLQKKSFDRQDSTITYYIFVMRKLEKGRYVNDFLIFPNSSIKHFVNMGVLKDNKSMSLLVENTSDGGYLLNNSENVTAMLNRFDEI